MTAGSILEGRSGSQVSREVIQDAMGEAGITVGDIVMVHSRLFTVGKSAPGIDKGQVSRAFAEALGEAVGPGGTIIIPTFTLSVCQTGYFDTASTPSEMGALTEYVRLRAPGRRTPHPIYSAVILGADAELFSDLNLGTCFGKNSLFDRLHTANSAGSTRGRVKFVTIGIGRPPEGITYIHSIEERLDVPYRYHKSFQGTIRDGDTTSPYDVDFFVRDREAGVEFDGVKCWDLLQPRSGVSTVDLGDSLLCVIPEGSIFDALSDAIESEPDFLCKGGYRPAGSSKA